jgi:hypothetical protein
VLADRGESEVAVNVGLLAVDGIGKGRLPNLALMRRAAWHKAQGHSVEIAWPLKAHTYDLIERSKQFVENGDEYPDDQTPWPCEVVSGGTGYDLASTFGPDHDTIYPDYGLYGCYFALGRLTRGCIRSCPWCVVWRQDGRVRQVAELSDFLRDQTHLRLMDDNLTAMADLFVATCEELARRRTRVKWESLDVRLMRPDMARALARVRRWGQVHFAWDSIAEESAVRRGIAALKEGGFPLYAATFYVLIGFDTTPEEDAYRVDTLNALGVESFVMPFDKTDPYQRRFARMTNCKEIFRTTHPRESLRGRS